MSPERKETEIYMQDVHFGQAERERRLASPRFAAGEDVQGQLAETGHVYIVADRVGFNIHTFHFWIRRNDPGAEEFWKTLGHRHTVEAVIYILSGRGYSIIDGLRYDWEPGDFINVPVFAWHRHIVTSDEPMYYLAATTNVLQRATGMALYEDERFPELWVYAQKGQNAQETLVPGGAEATAGEAGVGSPGRAGKLFPHLYQQELDFAQDEERRRRAGRVLVKHSDLQFESTPMGQLAYVVDPRLGFHNKALCTQVLSLPSAKRSGAHRHLYEEVNHVLSGHGHCMIEGERQDWKAGDTLYVPTYFWHQHFNTGDNEARILMHNSRPAMENLGLAFTEQGEPTDY